MEPIRVPGPPKESFNKNRRPSDLLRAQIHHLQHIESKLPTALHANMTGRDLATEQGAARYIAHVTGVLCSGAAIAPPPARSPELVPVLVPPRAPARKPRPRPAAGIQIAAVAEMPSPAARKRAASRSAPSSAPAPPKAKKSSRPKPARKGRKS